MRTLVNQWKILLKSNRSSSHASKRRQHRFHPGLELLEDRRVPATLVFNGTFGDSWHIPGNWSGADPQRVPTSADTAVINGHDVSVVPGTAAGAMEMFLANGTLTVNGIFGINGGTSHVASSATVVVNGGDTGFGRDAEMNGRFIWNGGRVNASLINHGEITLASDDPMFGHTFVNHGIIRHVGAGALHSAVDNQPDGVYDLQTDADIVANAFINSGTLRKSAGVGTSEFPFSTVRNEGGRVEVKFGTLVLGGPNTSGYHTGGHFVVDGGAALELPGGGSYIGTYTGEGAGLVRIFSGDGSGQPSIGIGNGGATFNFPLGLFHWTRGMVVGTYGPLRNAGAMTLSGPDRKYYGGASFALENSGTIVHTDTGVLEVAGVLNNAGVYQLRSDAGISGFATINNTGVFAKLDGSGTSQLAVGANIGFNNALDGRVEIAIGNLRMSRQTNSGIVSIAAGSALEIGGIPNVPSSYTQTATGRLELELDGVAWSQVRSLDLTGDTPINLAGTLILTENARVGGTFVIIDNDRSDPVNGTFSGLPEGSIIVTSRGTRYQISYRGGTGNDVTLTNLSPSNQPPVAFDHGFTVAHSETLTVPAPGLFGDNPDPDGDPVTAEITTAPEHGVLVLQVQTGAFTYNPDTGFVGTDSFRYLLNDGLADSNIARVTIIVTGPTNEQPTANAGGPYTIAEGDSLALDASASFDPEGSDLDYAWDINGDGDFTDAFTVNPRLSWETLNDLGIVDGLAIFNVRVQLSDGVHPPVTSPETTLTVENAPPVVAIRGPAEGVRGQPLTFLIQAKDASPIDQAAGFEFHIGWGDGSDLLVVLPTPDNGLGIVVQHVFADVGPYEVKVFALDRDGDSGGVRHDVTIVALAQQPDPCDPLSTALVVGGTSDADDLAFRLNRSGLIEIRLNGQSLGLVVSSTISRVIAYGQAGDDTIQSRLTLPGLFDGGEDDDVLIGGFSSDVLVGGPGNDRLEGDPIGRPTGGRAGGGFDVLIGGQGADTLRGGVHSDLLIAGSTAFDANAQALCAVLDEWSSSRNYQTRVNNLRGTPNPQSSNRSNGDYFLMGQGPDATVFDDGERDRLTGMQGRDWFFANRTGRGVRDTLFGLQNNEEVDEIGLQLEDDAYEENDTWRQATPLILGGSIDAVLLDRDWFSFFTTANTVVRVTVFTSHPDDTVVRLYYKSRNGDFVLPLSAIPRANSDGLFVSFIPSTTREFFISVSGTVPAPYTIGVS